MSDVLMEIEPEKREVWFRLYPMDALRLREQLVPGARVNIRGVISAYEASGGYDLDGEKHAGKDRFRLSAGLLELIPPKGA